MCEKRNVTIRRRASTRRGIRKPIRYRMQTPDRLPRVALSKKSNANENANENDAYVAIVTEDEVNLFEDAVNDIKTDLNAPRGKVFLGAVEIELWWEEHGAEAAKLGRTRYRDPEAKKINKRSSLRSLVGKQLQLWNNEDSSWWTCKIHHVESSTKATYVLLLPLSYTDVCLTLSF